MKNKISFRHFNIGHVKLNLGSNHSKLLDCLYSYFQYIVCDTNDTCEEISIIILSFDQKEPLPFVYPQDSQVFLGGTNAKYFSYKELLITEFPSLGRVVINKSKGKFLGFTYASQLLSSDTDLEDFLHPLWELFRHYGLYSYHSGAICYKEHGLLIAGKSGRGKTTLTIDLISHGFEFLSDDRCLLREAGNSIEIIGFGEPVRIYPPNATHIEELAYLKDYDHKSKYALSVETVYPELIRRDCPLSGIIFPSWSPGEKTRLEPITTTQALLELLPLSMVCFDVNTSKRHFDFNYQLVSKFPSVILKMGDDKEHWHTLVIDFLKNC